MPSTNCSNCQAIVEQAYEFCPKCGTRIIHERQRAEILSDQESKPISQLESASIKTTVAFKEKHSSGVKTTFIWSAVLSLITLLFYTFKGMANADTVAQTLIQGVFARPLVVLLIAFIISIFFKDEKKAGKFNSVCTFVMAILTVGELGRWFVIAGS